MRSPIVPPMLDFGLNHNFDQAINDTKMRSPAVPPELDSRSSNSKVTACSKLRALGLRSMLLSQLSPDSNAFSDCTTVAGFRIEQFLEISNDFSGCTTVSDSNREVSGPFDIAGYFIGGREKL